MSRKMEGETCKRRRLSSDISEEMDNDFYEKLQTMEFIENQLQDLMVAVKRMKQSIQRRNKLKCKKFKEKTNIITSLIDIRKKINDDIDKDIENINKLKSVSTIKDSLIENLNNVRESKNKDIDDEIFYVKSIKNDNIKIKDKRSRVNSYEENISKLSDVKKKIKKYVNGISFARGNNRKKVYLDSRRRSLSDEYKDRASSEDTINVIYDNKIMKNIDMANAIIDIYQNVKEASSA